MPLQTRLNLRPGQAGTRKLLERDGAHLVCVRYRYDAVAKRRIKTIELIIDEQPWQPRPRKPGRSPDDSVQVRLQWHEGELRGRALRLGAIWRPEAKLWEMTWAAVKRPGITGRVKGGRDWQVAQATQGMDGCRYSPIHIYLDTPMHMPADGNLCIWIVAYTCGSF